MNEAEQSDSDDPKATGVTTNSEQASSEKWQMDSEEYNDCMDEMEQYRDDEQDEKMPQISGDANNPLANLRKRRLLKKAPNAPKRFKSAYICFVTEKMEDVKKDLPPDKK
eukprot:gene27083-32722_t